MSTSTPTPSAPSKTWFVTGASRGFGRLWSEAALSRGDRVALAVRDTSSVEDLVARHPDSALALPVDVAHRTAVHAAVRAAADRFGGLDVVVANAGFGLFGAVEEVTEEQARRQLDVNVLGVVWLLQAVAPVLRAQGRGRVLLTSSFGGVVSYPTAGLYGASKYALEGLGESFALETSDLGIDVTLIEPGAYATEFGGASAEQTTPIDAYASARARVGDAFAAMPPGDPAHTVDAVLTLVDMDAPPLRLLLGSHVRPVVLDASADRVASWREHAELTDSAQ